MLPDFLTMAGLRLEAVMDDPELERGVNFHHLTDDVFHSAPIFEQMMASASEELTRRGMDKWPATAIGHVGVELLLDGALVSLGHSLGEYRSAVNELPNTEHSLRFSGSNQSDNANKWRRLALNLPSSRVPEGYADSDFVAARLIGILNGRPYLSVPLSQQPLVFSWAERWASKMPEMAPRLLAQVQDRLGGKWTNP
jgi:hypothetical protein